MERSKNELKRARNYHLERPFPRPEVQLRNAERRLSQEALAPSARLVCYYCDNPITGRLKSTGPLPNTMDISEVRDGKQQHGTVDG